MKRNKLMNDTELARLGGSYSRELRRVLKPFANPVLAEEIRVYRPRQAWQWMQQTLVAPEAGDWVRSEVVDAWRRCIEDYPLRPRAVLPLIAARGGDWDIAAQDFDPVLLEAFRALDGAADAYIGETELTVCLVDSRCRLVALQGQNLSACPIGQHLGQAQADWSESVIGNNGMGTAAVLSAPVAFAGEEHYLPLLHPFTTAGFPLLDDNGKLLAVLGLIGVRHSNPGVLKSLLSMLARRMEDQWLRHQVPEEMTGKAQPYPLGIRHPATLDIPGREDTTAFGTAAGSVTSGSRQSQALVTRLTEKAVRLQERQIPILVVGESGAGKEYLVRKAYEAGPRRHGPFIAVNCASIPRDLIESELFGYAAGSFTGACKEGKVGKFLLADKGVLFLDEIGDMGLDLQAVLLRVLENSEFYPVGATKPVQVDVQIFAATNVPIQQAVREGRFRRDLYYRLNGAQLILPPLRDREDKSMIIQEMLEMEQKRSGRIQAVRIGSAVMELFLRHPWPGNIRQLSNVIRSSLHMAEGPEITPADLTDDFFEELRQESGWDAPVLATPSPAGQPMEELSPSATTLAEWEFQGIKVALESFNGNLTKTAKALGITRGTLYKKMELYGLGARKFAK